MTLLFRVGCGRTERVQRALHFLLCTGLGLLIPLATTDASEHANELRFSDPPKMTLGDTWSYLLSSSDRSLDGKILRIALEDQKAGKRSFSVRLSGGEPQSVSLDQGIAWFMPAEVERGVIGLQEVPHIFDHVERGIRSDKSEVTYRYDANGVRYADGYYVHGVGPVSTVVPGGEYSCAQITKESASAVATADRDVSASSNVVSDTWLSTLVRKSANVFLTPRRRAREAQGSSSCEGALGVSPGKLPFEGRCNLFVVALEGEQALLEFVK